MTPWSTRMRFVALGDSTTAGLGDPLPDGRWRGWAALLADGLAAPGGVDFLNVATSGALTADVRRDQLPAALARRPHLASVVVGGNDTLRGAFDLDRISTDLDHVVGALRACGATVLTARLPDPGRMFNLPPLLARPMSRRVAGLNRVADEIAAAHGTVHLDLAGQAGIYARPMWSVDRLHPSERGHRFLARGYAHLLLADGVPVTTLPSLEPAGGARPSTAGHLWWLATRGTRWVLARSRDLAPQLAVLAAQEWWAQVRGRPVADPTGDLAAYTPRRSL